MFDLKSLDKKDARLALRVYNFSRTELGVDLRGESLVLAVSGGADSSAMFLMFRALRDYLGLKLFAAHLDHALRPTSAEEALTVRELCKYFQVPLSSRRLPIADLAAEKHIGLEEAGRTARYSFFEEVRQKHGANWILTAHHLGDLAEDILLRLIRGAGWPGIGGMPAVRGKIIRPLLLTEKQELLYLLRRQGISWLEDRSNQSLDYKRNRIRLEILPLLIKENPGLLRNMRKLWVSARQDEICWQEIWDKLIGHQSGALFFKRKDLLGLPKAARLKLYAISIKDLGGQALANNLHALDHAFLSGSQKTIQLPGFISAHTETDCLRFVLNTVY